MSAPKKPTKTFHPGWRALKLPPPPPLPEPTPPTCTLLDCRGAPGHHYGGHGWCQEHAPRDPRLLAYLVREIVDRAPGHTLQQWYWLGVIKDLCRPDAAWLADVPMSTKWAGGPPVKTNPGRRVPRR